MDIVVSEYTREDGVSAHRLQDDKWIVKCSYGPPWFWDVTKNDWELYFNPEISLLSFAMPLNKAVEVLAVVKHKDPGRRS